MLIAGCVSAAEPWAGVTSRAGCDNVPLVTDAAPEVPWNQDPAPGRAQGSEHKVMRSCILLLCPFPGMLIHREILWNFGV